MLKLQQTGIGIVSKGNNTKIIGEDMKPRLSIVKIYENTENKEQYKTSE